MHGHSELIPELLTVDDVPVEGRYIQLGKFDSLAIQGGRRSKRGRSLTELLYTSDPLTLEAISDCSTSKMECATDNSSLSLDMSLS